MRTSSKRARRGVNEERAKIGLGPVASVRDYMFTDIPWLAADPVLAPAFPTSDMQVVQTGAWMLSDPVPLIVHHGGAGTTHAAARAGTPQVIIPHNYDQFYWAHRVQELGIRVSGPTRDDLTTDGLAQALRECLQPELKTGAQSLAGRMEVHGARLAAERLIMELENSQNQ